MSLKKAYIFKGQCANMVTCVFRVSIRKNNGPSLTRAGRGARVAYIDRYLLIIVKSSCKTTQYNKNASTTGPSPAHKHVMCILYMHTVLVYQGLPNMEEHRQPPDKFIEK